MARNVFCYQAALFGEYSGRLIRSPQVLEGMEEVTQPDDHDSQCACLRSGLKRDEL